MRQIERTGVPEEKPLGARQRTQATLVGGECSHLSIILGPQKFTIVKVIAPCGVQRERGCFFYSSKN